jgi:SAM-dependent methyltransferase
MDRASAALLERISRDLSQEDRAEMAIPSYLHRNPALRWMAWRRLEVVVAAIERLSAHRAPDSLAVDFGCGSGILFKDTLKHFARVIGVDPVLDAATKLRAELGLSDVELCSPTDASNKIQPGSADLIIAAEVLEHVDDLKSAVKNFSAWLKPHGRLLASLPTENAVYKLGRRLAGFSGHYHHSNAQSIDGDLRALGFRREWREQIPAPGPFSIYWVMEYTWAP